MQSFALISSKLVQAIISIFGSLVLVFSILYLLPGDPVLSLVDPTTVTPEAIENLRRELGLDRPFYAQFLDYLKGVLTGDLGVSRVTGEPVIDKIVEQLPATLLLTLCSMIFSIIFGITLGVLSAVYRNKWLDVIIRFIALFGISMPTFWSGILLILFLGVQLNWLPIMGSDGWQTLIMPSISLGLIGAGFIIRMVRNSMVDILKDPYILTLRAKGLNEKRIMFVHVLKNALIPAITIIGLNVGEMLAGTVVIETVFSRQGIGRLISDALAMKDLYVIQGVILFSAIVYVVMNMLVDLSYSLLDPRIRKASNH
jgi:peptide/nickel transport system permease protein